MEKGISPFVAAIIIIALTVAVGGLLAVWFSNLTSSQTQTVQGSLSTQVSCAQSALEIVEVRSYGADGLIGFWRFDETSGVNTSDSWKNGVAGQINANATRTAAGFRDGAVVFNGSVNHISIPHSSVLDIDDAITISAWVNPTTIAWGQRQPAIVGKRDFGVTNGQDENYVFLLNVGAPEGVDKPGLTFFYRDTGGSQHIYATQYPNLSSNRWTHVAVSFVFGNNASMKMYVNGTEASGVWVAGNGSLPPVQNAVPLLIGSSNRSTSFNFNGTIDDVKLYNKSLSEQEIRGIMNSTSARYVAVTLRNSGQGALTNVTAVVVSSGMTKKSNSTAAIEPGQLSSLLGTDLEGVPLPFDSVTVSGFCGTYSVSASCRSGDPCMKVG